MLLRKATPCGRIGELWVYYTEGGDDRVLVVTDSHKNIAAYAGFISRLNGKVWQAKNLETYDQYKGQQLGAQIYKFVKEQMKKSIQSDIEQSPSAEILWTKTLPSIGLSPKIFDTATDQILDHTSPDSAYQLALSTMYSSNYNNQYTWVLEKHDQYNENSILKEASLLMPYTGSWYNFAEEKL